MVTIYFNFMKLLSINYSNIMLNVPENKLPLRETSFQKQSSAFAREKSEIFFRSAYESDTGQSRSVLTGES